MKIGDRSNVQDPRLQGAGGLEPRRPGGDGGGDPEATDHLALSDISRALARFFSAASAASEATPERSQRLEELRRQVESGTYHPDPQATARKLLLDELA